jgi:hypothetical protein
MTDYCSLADAQDLIAEIEIDESTTPSLTQAGRLVSFVTADLNGLLRGYGYPLPVPASDLDLLADLRVAASYGVAARIVKAKYPADSGTGSDQGAAGELAAEYNSRKDLLRARAASLGASHAARLGEGFTKDSCGRPHRPIATRRMSF